MPFGPSALSWWAWLLCALALLVLLCVVLTVATDQNGYGGPILIALLMLATLLTGGIGVVQFVKWAWSG
jgi:hypothetical protein